MAAQNKQLINLLPQEEFAASTLGRILKWLLGTFRIIVISTEMVVMIGFLSRFYFDARNSDLSEAITQKKAVIQSFQQVEKDFRDAQARLTIFSGMTKNPVTFLSLALSVTSRLPVDTKLTYMSLSGSVLQLKGTATSEQAATTLIANLQDTKLFKTVEITQIEQKQGDNFFSLTVKATLKGTS